MVERKRIQREETKAYYIRRYNKGAEAAYHYEAHNFRQKWMSLLQEADVFLGEPKEWRIDANNLELVFHVLQLQLRDKSGNFRSSI